MLKVPTQDEAQGRELLLTNNKTSNRYHAIISLAFPTKGMHSIVQRRSYLDIHKHESYRYHFYWEMIAKPHSALTCSKCWDVFSSTTNFHKEYFCHGFLA